MNLLKGQRKRMVERQIAFRGVTDPAVLKAMLEVPREAFVSAKMREFSYEDRPLPIEEGQTISQPYIVALMAEAMGLSKRDRVLEIGTGSGYAAAVLSRICHHVYGIERYEKLADLAQRRAVELGYDNVTVRCGDGTVGWPDHAPFDAILVSASGPDVPQSLLQQLAIGGRLVIPIGENQRSQDLLHIVRTGEEEFETTTLTKVQFVPLVGIEGWAADGRTIDNRRPSL